MQHSSLSVTCLFTGESLQKLLGVSTNTSVVMLHSDIDDPRWEPLVEVEEALSSLPDQRQEWVDIVTCHCRTLHLLHLLGQGNPRSAFGLIDSMMPPLTAVSQIRHAKNAETHLQMGEQCCLLPAHPLFNPLRSQSQIRRQATDR